MSTPVPALVPMPAAPLATDSDAQFDAKAFPWAAGLNPFATSVSAIAVSAKDNADAALAAALAGDLPSITGQALKLLRVNAGETAAEFVAFADLSPELTQVQVQDATDTTFGRVSGERLAQAVVASRLPDCIFSGPVTASAGTVPLDTTIRNEGGFASLATNTITLAAGSYLIEVSSSLRLSSNIAGLQNASIALEDVTGSAFIAAQGGRADGSGMAQYINFIASVTPAASNNYRIDFDRDSSNWQANAGNLASGHSGTPTASTFVKIWRV